MEGNIRIYRLPMGRGTDQWTGNGIARAGDEGNIISTGPYHDPRAVCLFVKLKPSPLWLS